MDSTHSERRRSSRRACSLPVQLRPAGQAYFTGCETIDLSPYGCYLKLLFPVAVGTVVDLRLVAGDMEVKAQGVVKTSDPGLGNGIGFTEMTPADQLQLARYLDTLPEAAASEFIL